MVGYARYVQGASVRCDSFLHVNSSSFPIVAADRHHEKLQRLSIFGGLHTRHVYMPRYKRALQVCKARAKQAAMQPWGRRSHVMIRLNTTGPFCSSTTPLPAVSPESDHTKPRTWASDSDTTTQRRAAPCCFHRQLHQTVIHP